MNRTISNERPSSIVRKDGNETIEKLNQKIKWLEKRNMEYSQRLRDINSEKRQS